MLFCTSVGKKALRALKTRTPIIPFAFLGGGEAIPTVFNAVAIGRMLGAVNYQGYLGLEYEAAGNPMEAVPAVLEQMRRAFPR